MRYELSIEVENLPSLFFGLRNVRDVYGKVLRTDTGEVIGATEVITRARVDSKIVWTKCFYVEQLEPIKVCIYDDPTVEGKPPIVECKPPIVEGIFDVSEILRQPLQMQELITTNGRTKIWVAVNASQKGNMVGYMNLHLRGLSIKNVEAGVLGLGRTDPYFEIAKKRDNNLGVVIWNTIYRSEALDDILNPFWKEFQISVETLCNCDQQWPIMISVYDFEDSGKHRMIGQVQTTLEEMQQNLSIRGNADRETAFQIKCPEVDPNDQNPSTGLLCVLKADHLQPKF